MSRGFYRRIGLDLLFLVGTWFLCSVVFLSQVFWCFWKVGLVGCIGGLKRYFGILGQLYVLGGYIWHLSGIDHVSVFCMSCSF